jgi:hypothetical protein
VRVGASFAAPFEISKGTRVHALSVSPGRQQSQGEEIANSISHGLALLATLIGAPYLLIHAARHEDDWFVIGASIFTATRPDPHREKGGRDRKTQDRQGRTGRKGIRMTPAC